jgi:predicted GNAT family acetyltransferase
MVHRGELAQSGVPPKPAGCEVTELKESDVPEMSEVYAATRPGRTLCPRIQQLGAFLGVRDAGRLVAMGGLRLHLAGYREITTVGTRPGQTGHGYATAIVSALVQRIRNAGERPFLTAGADNARAVEIYQRLGFKTRARLHSHTIRFAG